MGVCTPRQRRKKPSISKTKKKMLAILRRINAAQAQRMLLTISA